MDDLTESEQETYDERLAICLAQDDIDEETARKVAREQIEREPDDEQDGK